MVSPHDTTHMYNIVPFLKHDRREAERARTHFSQSFLSRSPAALSSPFSFTSSDLVPVLVMN